MKIKNTNEKFSSLGTLTADSIDALVEEFRAGLVSVDESSDAVLAALIEGRPVSDERKKTLARAIELGADEKTLGAVRDSSRVWQASTTILLPVCRLETLSHGKGWCRKGRGDGAEWGERERGKTGGTFYRVGPGHWTVYGSDGFSRQDRTEWDVEHVTVGTETWTIAN